MSSLSVGNVMEDTTALFRTPPLSLDNALRDITAFMGTSHLSLARSLQVAGFASMDFENL